MEKRQGFYFVVNTVEQKAVLSKSIAPKIPNYHAAKCATMTASDPQTTTCIIWKISEPTLPISSSKLQHLSTCTLVFRNGYYCAKFPDSQIFLFQLCRGDVSHPANDQRPLLPKPAEHPDPRPATGRSDASQVYPNCSTRLRSYRCKMTCPTCGFFLSCSDFY